MPDSSLIPSFLEYIRVCRKCPKNLKIIRGGIAMICALPNFCALCFYLHFCCIVAVQGIDERICLQVCWFRRQPLSGHFKYAPYSNLLKLLLNQFHPLKIILLLPIELFVMG
uniref:Uncharacterized protein n=1 Tax=Corethron hystrix TaxID=216773 RepID=A0A7S1B971_9STRA